MAKIKRSEKPKCLSSYIWNEEDKSWYKGRTLQDWDKPRFSNTQCYKEVKEELIKMCNGTCPFCFQTCPPEIFFEIEHFRPKKYFPDLIFQWDNLFPIYRYINGLKSDDWDYSLKSPEEIDYLEYMKMNTEVSTEKYGFIESRFNEKENPDGYKIAQTIIKVYHLNDEKMVSMRIWWFENAELKPDSFPFCKYFK